MFALAMVAFLGAAIWSLDHQMKEMSMSVHNMDVVPSECAEAINELRARVFALEAQSEFLDGTMAKLWAQEEQ